MASESFGATRSMHWWVIKQGSNASGRRQRKSKDYIRVEPSVPLANGTVMVCPPGLMPDSLHTVEQELTVTEGRIVLTYCPGRISIAAAVKQPQDTYLLACTEQWELDCSRNTTSNPFHVRFVGATASTVSGKTFVYPLRRSSGKGCFLFGPVLALNGASLVGIVGSRALMTMLQIHCSGRTGMISVGGEVESLILR